MRLKIGALLLLSGTYLSAAIHPIALSSISDGKLIGLDESNCLIVAEIQSKIIQQFGLPKQFQILDLAAAGRLEDNMIFISTHGRNIFASPILQCSAHGAIVRQWEIPASYPSGLALDSSNHLLYISTLQDVSIYLIDLKVQKGGKPRYLTQVGGAVRLSAMALDSSKNRLFVADVFSGTIYTIPLGTLKSSIIATNLGEPTSLAITRDGVTLYVADRAHRCIWAINLRQLQPTPHVFWSSRDLREPMGIALDDNGTVWVADRRAGAIFGVTREGHEAEGMRIQSP